MLLASVPELQELAHALLARPVQVQPEPVRLVQAARPEPVQGQMPQAQAQRAPALQALGPLPRLPASHQAARICAFSFQRRQPSCGRG